MLPGRGIPLLLVDRQLRGHAKPGVYALQEKKSFFAQVSKRNPAQGEKDQPGVTVSRHRLAMRGWPRMPMPARVSAAGSPLNCPRHDPPFRTAERNPRQSLQIRPISLSTHGSG
jgi:hypothetical protein